VPQRNDLKMKEMYRSKPRMSPPPKVISLHSQFMKKVFF
jgi:hypothetical protein